MGHAGAIVSGGKGDAKSKMAYLEKNGITVCKSFTEIGDRMLEVMGKV